MNITRNRFVYLLLAVATIALGLASRRLAGFLPNFINLGLGDALWAVMVYLFVGAIFNRWAVVRTATVSLAFCYLIEISQLYHAPWIDAIRATRMGGLVLGFGFLWSDMVAYTLGVAAVAIVELLATKKMFRRASTL